MEAEVTGTQAPPDSDADLLRDVGAGDAAALRELYQRHAKLLSVRLWRRCGDPQIVEEVVQDTFLAAWRGAASYLGFRGRRQGTAENGENQCRFQYLDLR